MLVAFSGLKTSGKDTAASVLVEEYGFTKIAFADALRETLLILNPPVWADPDNVGELVRLSDVVAQFGWDFAKNNYAEVRRLMQVFGTEIGRNIFDQNVWINFLTKKYKDIADKTSRYVITDCRFDNEVKFVQEVFGTLIWIDRPGVVSDGHASESVSIKNSAHYVITNNSTIQDLQEDVRFLMNIKGVDTIDSSREASETVN